MPSPIATVRSYGMPQDNAAQENAPLAAQDIATTSFTGAAPTFSYAFPPYSLTLFTFTPQPPWLGIVLSTTNTAVVFWTTNSAFTLQTNANLSTANWGDYGGSINTANGTNSVTIAPLAGNLFFRLSNP